jgi:2-polyprenyl-3-methyl-5-hydroxy-6-metoxy-1,4-benzoquinol methylase
MIKDSHDYVGHKNLEIISSSCQFNNWIYEKVIGRVCGSILELGSGLGVFSEKIVHDMSTSEIILTDKSLSYLNNLENKFANRTNVTVNKLDLECITDYQQIGYDKFDTIIAINVLEHVKNDTFVFEQLYRMLRKNGTIILLVPSYKFLYNHIDLSIGHERRYTKKELQTKIQKCQFIIEQIQSFNLAGILGWYVNGNLLRNAAISTAAVKLFDRLVPFWKFLDHITFNKIGLSIICYLRRID